ncbi:zinc ribbon domain-containing protein [Halomarina halobia]
MPEYKCEREEMHFVAVDSVETTKECGLCGVETVKPLWAREHSFPTCESKPDRDPNVAWNILSHGLKKGEARRSESTNQKIEGF